MMDDKRIPGERVSGEVPVSAGIGAEMAATSDVETASQQATPNLDRLQEQIRSAQAGDPSRWSLYRNPSFVVAVAVFGMTFVIFAFIIMAQNFEDTHGRLLRRAATAQTAEVALSSLDQALRGLEADGLTHGNTAFFRARRETDIGLWYQGLRSARTELQTALASSPASEASQQLALRRFHDRLAYGGPEGTVLIMPESIACHPWNRALLGILFALVLFVFLGIWNMQRRWS